ncbi:MurR/RpiR family transcriptional regulator [Clostridium sp. C8-1-8]|uniref:MurR/RpiR family transcriptional regulator n=1 Tax=Clostridium sp. C8-1-8 TaxID=2698831 RepID=UPI00136EE950|nr:MurR/RpiR family transcriptional regulator [Clostridium sp. C8-1-8]
MLLTEKMMQVSFSESEKIIIDYIFKEKEDIKNKTTKQIAQQTYTHPSTTIRIAKKLGYNGWNELKEAYLEEIKYLDSHFENIDANFPFTEDDSIMAIANKIATLNQTTIKDTLSLIHHDDLQKAVQFLHKASEIKVFANNQNLIIAQDFMLKMNRIQKSVSISLTDSEQVFEAFNCKKGCCAIIISYSGEDNPLIKAIPVLKQNSVPIIAITSLGDNTLASKADCVLRITTRERLYSKIANFTTNDSICYLLDVLYSCVFSKDYDKNLEHKIMVSKYFDPRKSSVDLIKED